MESTRESVDTQQSSATSESESASSKSEPSSPTSGGSPALSNSSPVAADKEKRSFEHDSLVTVRLSEPPSLLINTAIPPNPLPSRKTLYGIDYTPTGTIAEDAEEEPEATESEESESESDTQTLASDVGLGLSLQEELDEEPEETSTQETGVMDLQDSNERTSEDSQDSEPVDWDTLQKKEDLESKEQDSDKTTAMLLARLEQENAKFSTNPKTVKVDGAKDAAARRPRPPSMAQLRQMVDGPTPPVLRYSVLPPPPMTELEFYMALVKDPQQTAARLPTLLSNKIRKGIPPPLRGLVWQSMSGARDTTLEEAYERLSGESSPYEGIITKDLGRSFPGVEMFRDAEGDGQRMLGRVLKCFSLYDTKIGYCQGLAFLVGPLLMHMPDKQAFCVLVRLMENYDLRHCFVPDLSGLHVRIYQFRELLRQHWPALSAHLDDLQVEPAYVSQWFLSFFAVTCPLPLLFRIYDVIFAEGASETIMRVALTLMRKNQARILACAELEDVMQLLLSRKVWDVYNLNADEFVQDFVNLSDVVTRERMAALEQGFRETKLTSGTNARSTDAAQISDVTTAASRFLGRLWATSSTPKLASLAQAATFGAPSSSSSSSSSSSPLSAASNTLSPGLSAPSRPLSMLRRSASKQSLASTLNSMDAAASAPSSSAASVLSSSTDATTISRDSAPDSTRESSKTTAASFSGAGHGAKDDTKYLHSQIEDLLTALNELQRSNALLVSQLQKEREEREEDNKAVRALVEGLRDGTGKEALATSTSSDETIIENKSTTTLGEATDRPTPTPEQVSELIDAVEARFGASDDSRRSSIPQTRSQLQDDLARAKEQLSHELAKTQQGNRRIYELEQEMATYKEQLRESHAYVRTLHADKQRIEKQMNGLRVRSDTPSSGADAGNWFTQATGAMGAAAAPGVVVPAPKAGLRELKLGRSRSTPSQVPQYSSKRASSMMSRESVMGMTAPSAPPDAAAAPPPSNQHDAEHDAILIQLAQAKTAEAIARQEAEEARQKLETLRKAFGLAPGETPSANNTVAATAANGASAAASAAMGMIGRLTGSTSPPASEAAVKASPVKAPAPAPAAAASGTAAAGGFWGWRR
ncbi:rab-GTPase-TBC domain-containing protein [Schizothecium vesticola]|uniref:Rab-GTPase-TBC domain-containing protein n=1 Tax=Schizothecium vesticola TaxID=314040 RepID=A0AA40ERH5_9PEZI|nr:rab-GTPase-TBC domain-containing protein [Schizothecium vesticola]